MTSKVKKPILERYQEHVAKMSEELGCKIIQGENYPGMMYVEFGHVEGPIIRNQSDYLTMLHELGHFALGHTQGRPPHADKTFYFQNGVLHSEAQAWEWALDACIDEPSEESRRFMWDKCLGSYYSNGYLYYRGKQNRLGNGNRHWVPFVYDHPDAYFDSIVKRIQGKVSYFNVAYSGKATF